MEAGRELDALVAERVMGWRRMTDGEVYPGARFDEVYPNAASAGFGRERVSDWWFDASERDANGDAVARARVEDFDDYDYSIPGFAPSAKHTDAWEVVDAMVRRGFNLKVNVFPDATTDGRTFTCDATFFFPKAGGVAGAGSAATVPLAICRAALSSPSGAAPTSNPEGTNG